MQIIDSVLVEGDPLMPCSIDLIAQTATIPVGQPVPQGWLVVTGNSFYSKIARVALRHVIEGKKEEDYD